MASTWLFLPPDPAALPRPRRALPQRVHPSKSAASREFAVGLVRHGCRLVLLGNEGALAETAEEALWGRRGGDSRGGEARLRGLRHGGRRCCGRVGVACFGGGGLDSLVNYCFLQGF